MADLAACHYGLPELLPELVQRLRQATPFDIASLSLYDQTQNTARVHLWEGSEVHPRVAELPASEAICTLALEEQRPIVWPDVGAETRFQSSVKLLRDRGVRSYCALPLTSSRRKLGAMGLGSAQSDAYPEGNVRQLSSLAKLITLALENAIAPTSWERESDRLQALLQAGEALASGLSLGSAFPAISAALARICPHDHASLTLFNGLTGELRRCAWDSSLDEAEIMNQVASLERAAALRALEDKQSTIYVPQELVPDKPELLNYAEKMGIRFLCSIPLIGSKGGLGTVNLLSKEEPKVSAEDLNVLKHIGAGITVAVEVSEAKREMAELTAKLKQEKLYLQDEIRSALSFEEIVGESPILKRVLTLVQIVAPSPSTVLILGETGTGKELIARAIHRTSLRKDASFIKLNCAAIPTGLLESELFGHEKGAFTGAISQKIGRLELAHQGTLFLDEVGDIPLELQPKLLRVLQDQEFERLGGTRTIKVDIRLIAATNRDLAEAVQHKEFRSDLYYRLHVFPVRLPPLRERTRDIPLLVRYFVQKFARRMNKRIDNIPSEAMNALASWYWPGNVRELENFIERSVILTEGPTLLAPLAELRATSAMREESTLENLEREHILRVLRETGGVISGVHGAAARLGLKRTTLQSRMQKMGISRKEYEN